MMVKREKSLLLGRPEGEKMLMPGEQIEGAGASAKPILLRIACDRVQEEDNGPVCIQACPYGVLTHGGLKTMETMNNYNGTILIVDLDAKSCYPKS